MLTGAAVLILLAVVVILDQVVTIKNLKEQLEQTEQDRRVLGDALIAEVEEGINEDSLRKI